MGVGQGIIQTRTLLQLIFIQVFFVDQYLSGFTASQTHGVDFISDSRRSADGQSNVTFG
jgi:hypothetical protein